MTAPGLYTSLLLLVVCCVTYNAAPTETTNHIKLLDEHLTALYNDSSLTYTDRLQQLDILIKTDLKDSRTDQEVRGTPPVTVYQDCADALSKGLSKSGTYKISINGKTEMDVFCEQTPHDGPWTVIQRRINGLEDFDRTWSDYRQGFGPIEGDFYIGNDNIHLLTSSTNHKLWVQLHLHGHGFAYAEYSSFKIDSEEEKFKLHLGSFTGTNSPGDSLSYHNGQLFSTRDQDNDQDDSHCSHEYSSGWWFKDCATVNLNGIYGSQCEKGITWTSWMGRSTSLTSVKMMIQPADVQATTTTTAASTTEATMTPTTTSTTTSTSRQTPTPTTSTPAVYRDCLAAYNDGHTKSGVYRISPNSSTEIDIYCDQEIDGGGWAVFQSRMDGSVNFNHNWTSYKNGFGSIDGEYWLGNDVIHLMTVNQDQKLKVELQNDGLTAYADYSEFRIKDESEKYQLYVNGFTDGHNYPGPSLSYHNGMSFSTPDRDHDRWSSGNCAADRNSAWWYNWCTNSDLNAPYGDKYYNWIHWSVHNYYLDASRMMIRPK